MVARGGIPPPNFDVRRVPGLMLEVLDALEASEAEAARYKSIMDEGWREKAMEMQAEAQKANAILAHVIDRLARNEWPPCGFCPLKPMPDGTRDCVQNTKDCWYAYALQQKEQHHKKLEDAELRAEQAEAERDVLVKVLSEYQAPCEAVDWDDCPEFERCLEGGEPYDSVSKCWKAYTKYRAARQVEGEGERRRKNDNH